MSKTKSETKGAAAKASKKDSKAITAVKEGRITKPAQTPKAKSKEIAKSAASKVDKKSKKSKKEPTPEPESESESESSDSESEADSDSDSSSESSSDDEVETKTKAAKPAVVKKAESSDSSDSESDEDSDSSSSEEEAAPKTNGAAKPAAKESSDSDSDSDSSDSDSDEEEAPAKKADATSDSGSDSESDSEESESGSEESDSSDSDEEEAPSKKRKAEDEAEPIIKKAKTAEVADEGVKNLFVGNLSWSIDEEWLAREFESFGEITGCRIITDRETQRPKGFGYVEYATSEAAAKAKAEMHGKEVDGRALNVDFSTPRQNNNTKEKVGARAARFGDKPSVPSNTLFIGNLSFDSTNESIHEAFSAYGEISRVSLPTDRDTGNPKGFGYVDFGSVDEAKAALEALNGYEVDGRPIRVDYATPREDNGGGGGRGGRGGFGDRGGRGGGRGFGGGRGGGRGGRGGGRGGRGGFSSTNRGGFGDFQGKKMAF